MQETQYKNACPPGEGRYQEAQKEDRLVFHSVLGIRCCVHIVTIPSFSLFFLGRGDKGGVGFLHDKSLCFQAGISQLIKYLLRGILREFPGSARLLPLGQWYRVPSLLGGIPH